MKRRLLLTTLSIFIIVEGSWIFQFGFLNIQAKQVNAYTQDQLDPQAIQAIQPLTKPCYSKRCTLGVSLTITSQRP